VEAETVVVFETESNSKFWSINHITAFRPWRADDSAAILARGKRSSSIRWEIYPHPDKRTSISLNLRPYPRNMIYRPISMIPSHDGL
jgi:hypothetical protein